MTAWLHTHLDASPSLERSLVRHIREVRAEPWVFVQNPHTGTVLRVRLDAWHSLQALDGVLSVRDWLAQAQSTSERTRRIRLLGTLDSQGMLDWGMPDREADARRLPVDQAVAPSTRVFNPLGFRIPLFDPDGWLHILVERMPARVTPVALWLLGTIMLFAMLSGVASSDRIVEAWQRVLESPAQWWYYLLLFPLMKALHETAHGYALKWHGGEVHEAGISFLILVPLPYVDASDALLLPTRRQRILVSAAGMLAELAIASLALLVFLVVEPGLTGDVSFALFVLGTASTLLFNLNPLLRFDGYYILEDLLDMPALARRASAWYRYRFRRHLLGVRSASPPPLAARESAWLFAYGLSSTAYRLGISLIIAGWMVRQWHEAGLLVAALIAWQMLLRPALRFVRYLVTDDELGGKRLASMMRLGATTAVLGAALVVVPLPSSTRIEGMVWVSHQAELRVAESAQLAQWLVEEGDWVSAGEPIALLESPSLTKSRRQLLAERQAAQAALQIALTRDASAVQAARQALMAIDARLAHIDQRLASLRLTAGSAGHVVFHERSRAPGRLLSRGDVVAWLVDPEALIVRTVVSQARMGRVQDGIDHVAVRLAEAPTRVLQARLHRQVPAASHDLPSKALADDGFGGIAVAENEGEQLRTLERVFHVELELLTKVQPMGIGGRAYVTLAHAPESLGQRWWRQSHQLLLRHLMA